MKETLEEFLKRGGKAKKVKPGKYFGSGSSRYKMKDLDMGHIIDYERKRASDKKIIDKTMKGKK